MPELSMTPEIPLNLGLVAVLKYIIIIQDRSTEPSRLIVNLYSFIDVEGCQSGIHRSHLDVILFGL